ncbi:MAG: DUF1553 domain-containing protein [Verrucomicrobiota bacterium]|nr:DUF1553 domain-containing protein [Verrucomicrobiota bacterium]
MVWHVLAGAEHWAFVPPQKSPPPEVLDLGWVQNGIDRFILARLESEGIAPSTEASRSTLVRRLSLDLTGLPPSPDLARAFVQDDSPRAYSRLVERLLVSPQFGERQAQDWFDLARFADTSGYAADRTRNVWPFRDWVISAFNDNMPFDQFSINQLAGDLLPSVTMEQRVASAFHRHAMQAKGNNPRKEEFRIKGIVDRLESTGRTWLGLTLECAECHDHKHDPISQREYYEIFAIFNNVPHLGSGYGVHGPLMKYTPPAAVLERERLTMRLAKLREKIPFGRVEHEWLVGEWPGPTQVANADQFSLTGSLTITAEIETTAPIGDIVSKYDWKAGERSFVFGVGGEGDDKAQPGKLFAWFSSDAATFKGVVAYSSRRVDDGQPHHVAVVFEAGRAVRFFVDGIEDTAVRIEGPIPKTIAKSDRGLAVGAGFENSSKATAFRFSGQLASVRLYDRAVENPAGIDLSSPAVIEYRRLSDQLTKIAPAIEVPVMDELPRQRETHLLLRGDFKNKGEQVFAGTPKILPPLKTEDSAPADRLDFARWLFTADQPLTARVAMNRIWRHHFGEGLVRTVADFGRYGDRPSHPKLLDWLAVSFVECGWDVKAMHRLIVSSATYRQASRRRPDIEMVDPQNRLLAWFPRVRLPAEQIRDGALAAAGQLSTRIGGPSVFPLQPAGLYEERGQDLPGNSNFKWVDSTDEGRFRRSIYTYWKRMMLHPVMSTFDAPTRQICVAKRTVTNTPQQALVGLNEPGMLAAAKDLAKRLAKGGSDSAKVEQAFWICFSRPPDALERAKCLEFVKQQRLANREEWTALAAVLLNLDERLTRE